MKASEFKRACLDIIGPVYPEARSWIDANWGRIVDAVKLHSGRSMLEAFTNCVNFQGKLDFFFKDLARYLPRTGVGAGLVQRESDRDYYGRTGLAGSMAKPEPIVTLTEAEWEQGELLLQDLKKKFPYRVGGEDATD